MGDDAVEHKNWTNSQLQIGFFMQFLALMHARKPVVQP
jgi:hypothetical protein